MEAWALRIGLPDILGLEEEATIGRITRGNGGGGVLWGGGSGSGGKAQERRKDWSLGAFNLLIFQFGKSE